MARISWLTRPFARLARLIRVSWIKFNSDDCFSLSASISYVFLLAMIPFSTLGLFVLSVGRRMLSPGGESVSPLITMFADQIVEVIPFVSRDWVIANIIYSNDLTSFRIVNFLLLPLICGLIFKILESSYRRVFVLPPRRLLITQMLYAILSVFGVAVLFAMNFSWSIVAPSTAAIVSSVEHNPYYQQFSSAVSVYIPFQAYARRVNFLSGFVLVAFFLVTVKMFLGIKIRKRHQLVGALIFCALWLLARTGFGMYIKHVARVSLVYGSLSSIVLILMWVFYSSAVLLYSVEFMYALHVRRLRRFPEYATPSQKGKSATTTGIWFPKDP